MFFASERETLNAARTRARDIFDRTGVQPKVLSGKNLSTFFGELRYAIKLVLEEKEILFFAALQWVVIAIGYMVWTQVLDWIPDSAWEEAGRDDSEITFTFLSLALTGWSFFVVAVASYPISLLNAAITAAHYLRGSGQESTIARCLGLAFRNLGHLWVFTTIDAWITVDAILDRLPRKRGRRTPLAEALYYAWKIGTIGVVPSLVAGRGYGSAVRDSITLLRDKPARAIGIRMGYSLVCWIIGIAAYVGGFYYFAAYGKDIHGPNGVYNAYVLMALPIIIAVGVTAVLIRPFYLVMVAKLYTDVIPVGEDATVLTAGRRFDVPAFVFSTLLGVLLVAYFFGDQIGLRGWFEALAARDMTG